MDPITTFVIETLTKMVSDDYREIKRFVLSSEYEKMSNAERNKHLGRELAACISFRTMPVPFSCFPLIWQKHGTSNELREKIEDYFL